MTAATCLSRKRPFFTKPPSLKKVIVSSSLLVQNNNTFPGRENGSPDCFLSSSLDAALEKIEKEKENGNSLWADIKLLHLDLSHDMEETKSQLNFLREMLSNLKEEIRSLAKENGLQHMVSCITINKYMFN